MTTSSAIKKTRICTLIVLFFSNDAYYFLPFIAFCVAMLLSHPFSLNKSKFYPLLFIFFVVLNVAYLVANQFIF